MRIGICTSVCPDSMVDESLRLARLLEVEGVFLWAREPHLCEDFDPARVVSVSHLAAVQEVDVVGLRSALTVGARAPGARRRDDLERITQAARLMGCGLLTVGVGSQAGADSGALRLAAAELEILCERAESTGLRIAIEAGPPPLGADAPAVLSLVRAVGSPSLGVAWQPDVQPGQGDPLQDLEPLIPSLFVLNAADWRSDPAHFEREAPVVRALVGAGFSGWFCAVSMPGPSAERPLRLRSLLLAVDELAHGPDADAQSPSSGGDACA